MANLLVGIDLGGTKIEAVAIHPDHPSEPLVRKRVPTGAERGYEAIVSSIVALAESVFDASGGRPEAIGIGTPGVTDPTTGRLKNSNTTCLIGQPLRDDLEAKLDLPIVMANDANCFALAESRLGAARGMETVFGVIMGTGVGGGLVVHGQVLSGLQGIAGEWGHNILEPEGDPCYCGKRGCVETVLSGPSLERAYVRFGGSPARLPEIAERAEAGEEAAQRTLDRLCAEFGRALSVVVNIFDPHAIVLGGGVGNIGGLLTRGREELFKNVFNDRPQANLLRPTLGDSAGVFGAALLTSGTGDRT